MSPGPDATETARAWATIIAATCSRLIMDAALLWRS